MKVLKGFKYKLTPTKAQARILNQWIGANRCLYNTALQQRQMVDHRVHRVGYNSQAGELKSVKEAFPWMKEPPSQTLQQTLKDLDRAFKNFFAGRASYPRLKKKSAVSGIRFPTPSSIVVHDSASKKKGRVELPKIGVLKYRKSREMLGEIRSCTISKEAYGDYWVSFLCRVEIPDPVTPMGQVGIDRGIVHTLAFSKPVGGQDFSDLPVLNLKKIEGQIAHLQKYLAKKKKFSRNWLKLKNRISRLHSKMSRIRHDFLQKEATRIAKKHGLVVIEDLKVRNMSKSASGTVEDPGKMVSQKAGLNRSILRQGWHKFSVMLEHKVAENGGLLLRVGPKNTSRECSACGCIDAKSRPEQEKFCCTSCGYNDNADLNAAKTILARGTRVIALKVA